MRRPVSTRRAGRLCAAGSAGAVTLVTVLAGLGVLPYAGSTATASLLDAGTPEAGATPSTPSTQARSVVPEPDAADPSTGASNERPAGQESAVPSLPARSGTGKRVVFDISRQRVWLVGAEGARTGAAGEVLRSYLVSGSLIDNLDPGTYQVYSRSRWAVGIGESGVMQYFVRFTRGANAAIGFHSIPTKDGRPLQTRAQLGSPQSHGCIRQTLADARRLYAFAPEGTTVVVTA